MIADLEPIWQEISSNVAAAEYVLPAQRFRDPGRNRERRDYALSPASYQAIWRLVKTIIDRAGIAANVTPHTLRHAYCDHVARHAGLQVAQQAMGHANLATQSCISASRRLTRSRMRCAMSRSPPATNPNVCSRVRDLSPLSR